MQNILIVDDHDDARRNMGQIVLEAFGKPIVDEVSTLSLARARLAERNYDLVVLDLGLPDGHGEDFIAEILACQSNAYVVISTIHDESERLLAALENGARGYLLKEQPREFLVGEFRGILQGKPPLAPAVTRRLLELIRKRMPADAQNTEHKPGAEPEAKDTEIGEGLANASSLTDRESEILALLGKGFNRPEIAGILNISKHTVATHIAKVYNKLGISNRSDATLIARQLGLL